MMQNCSCTSYAGGAAIGLLVIYVVLNQFIKLDGEGGAGRRGNLWSLGSLLLLGAGLAKIDDHKNELTSMQNCSCILYAGGAVSGYG